MDSIRVIATDTIADCGSVLTEHSASIPPQILYAFLISFAILVFASIEKYTSGTDIRKIKKYDMLMELPIDICAIFATIVASMQTDKSYFLVLFMAICSVFPIIFCALSRQYWQIYAPKGITTKVVVAVIVNILTPIAWLVIICKVFFL